MMTGQNLCNALEFAAKKVGPEVQVNTLLVFLFVAQRGTCTQKDVELFLESSNAGTSRNISYWTAVRFDRTKGKNFIKRVEQSEDRRYRELTLTERGRTFYAELLKASVSNRKAMAAEE